MSLVYHAKGEKTDVKKASISQYMYFTAGYARLAYTYDHSTSLYARFPYLYNQYARVTIGRPSFKEYNKKADAIIDVYPISLFFFNLFLYSSVLRSNNKHNDESPDEDDERRVKH